MMTFIVETENGLRQWQADSVDHAREQHADAFPDEAILDAWGPPADREPSWVYVGQHVSVFHEPGATGPTVIERNGEEVLAMNNVGWGDRRQVEVMFADGEWILAEPDEVAER